MKVSLARYTSAFRTASGVFYALFEASYNTRETTPNPVTECVAFGSITQVMGWIFNAMTQCENGFIRSSHGAMTPEMYLAFWKEAMRRPDALFTQPVWISAGSGAQATVPTRSAVWYDGNRLPHAVRQFQAHGYDATAERVCAGETVVLDLHHDAAVLAAIYGFDPHRSNVAPWRIIQPQSQGEGNPSLAPVVRPAAPSRKGLPEVRVRRIGHINRYVAMVEGMPAMFGSVDELVSQYIESVALGCELRWRDGGTKAIESFRQVLQFAVPPIEDGFGVRVNLKAIDGMALFTDRVFGISEVLGHRPIPLSGEGAIVFALSDIRAFQLERELLSLPYEALGLVYPEALRDLDETYSQLRLVAA